MRRIMRAMFTCLVLVGMGYPGHHAVYAQAPLHDREAVGWSPDGDWVAVAYGGNLMILDAATGQMVSTLELSQIYPISQVTWNPNGNSLAVSTYEGDIHILAAVTWQTLVVLHDSPYVIDIAWNPAGDRLASVESFAEDSYVVQVWNMTTYTPMRIAEYHDLTSSVAWSPDGTKLANDVPDGPVRIWDTATWQIVMTIDHKNAMSSAWDPTGTRIVTVGGDDETVRVWNTAYGEELTRIPTDFVVDAEWSPDGSKLALADGHLIRIVDALTGQDLDRIDVGASINAVAWSPDGNQIAHASDTSSVPTILDLSWKSSMLSCGGIYA
jgi:WD40 repeat protein